MVLQVIAEAWPWFFPFIMILFGGVVGSFFTCALYRLPKGESLRQPPSFCDNCKKTLSALDLVPVFSWILLKGRCRHCGVRVSSFYTGIELVTIILALFAYFIAGLTFYLPVLLLVLWVVEFWFFYKVIGCRT